MKTQTLVIPIVSENAPRLQVGSPEWAEARQGEKNPSSRLTAAQVMELYASKEPRPVLARRYGVTVRMVGLIRQGKRWGWLTGAGDAK